MLINRKWAVVVVLCCSVTLSCVTIRCTLCLKMLLQRMAHTPDRLMMDWLSGTTLKKQKKRGQGVRAPGRLGGARGSGARAYGMTYTHYVYIHMRNKYTTSDTDGWYKQSFYTPFCA